MSREKLMDMDQEQLDLLHTILNRRIPDKTAWAYGSRVTWKAGETSDLDLAVFGCDSMEIYDLKEALEESDLLISVDVMDWESIPDDFKENIRGKYVVLQEKPTLEGWREMKLGDVAHFKTGKLNSNEGKPNGVYPFFTCSPETSNIDKYAFDEEAILLAGNNANGIFPLKYYNGKFNAYQRTYIINIDRKHCDYKFIYYVLKKQLANLETISHGTATKYLTLSILNNITVLIPSLPEQKAIAEVLSSLDDKIDLLHRQNKTLEDMAQALFRKWFVYGKNDTWETGKLGDVFTAKGGTTPSTKEKSYWNGDINWTTPRDLSGHNAIFLLDTEKRITEQGLAKISSGLLPAGTVLLSSRAPVGYLAITDIDLAINQGYIAIACDKILSNYFVYLWCKHNIEIIKKSSGGTVFQEIPKSVFRQIDIAIPPEKILSSFDQLIKTIFQKVKYNQYQIRKLENLRDTLLPKLMNGSVRAKVDELITRVK